MIRKGKWVLFFCLTGLILVGFVVVSSHLLIERTAEERIYRLSDDVPIHEVGLLLGCSPVLSNGSENLFFRYRIACAVELFKQGKIKHFIVSGDNSRQNYDESTAMRNALIESGVPADHIHPDYAGFSTLDSVVRAKEIFQQDRLIVISQGFHVRRAVYIGKMKGIEVAGVAAKDVQGHHGLKTHLREYLARVKTVLDIHVIGRSPRFLGEKITIVEDA